MAIVIIGTGLPGKERQKTIQIPYPISTGETLEQVFELLFGEPLHLTFTLNLGRTRYGIEAGH